MVHQHVCEDVVASDLTDIVSFHLSDVPEYLRETDFYFSLEDDGEEITLPKQFFKRDFVISKPVDARDLLSTMRFWGVEKVPLELIVYVAKSSHQDLSDMLSQFTQELKIVEFLRLLNLEVHHIRPSHYNEYINWRSLKPMTTTVESVVSILALQFKHERGQIWNENSTALAAEMGRLDCLMFLHEMGCPWDASTCANSAESNHLACLTYAHKHGCPWDARTTGLALQHLHTACFTYARDRGCPCDANTCSAAARFNKLSLLKFAHENGCPWDEATCEAAAWDDSLACLKYAHEQGCPWNASTCAAAACAGKLKALVYAHEKGCPWDETTCTNAAKSGNLDCLKFAHEQGCPWDKETCIAAATKASAACLAYAHKHGCPWGEKVVKEAAFHGSIDCLCYALENGCPGRDVACESVYGSLECLKYLREVQKCPWGPRVVDTFVRQIHDTTSCVKYCLEQGCLADETTMLCAVHSLAKMKVLCESGCPWDKRTMHAVAKAGDVEKLQYCFKNGCPGREDVALVAAPFLPLLQYLHGQGCPLPPKVYKRALQADRPIECVRFLQETGACPWPKQACTWFVQHRRMDCLLYAHTHGAPWDADTCAAAAHIAASVYGSYKEVCMEEEQRRALDFLCYLRGEGCPWNALTLVKAMQCRNVLCLQYAFQQKCPNLILYNDVHYLLEKDDANLGKCKIEPVIILNAASASAASASAAGASAASASAASARAAGASAASASAAGASAAGASAAGASAAGASAASASAGGCSTSMAYKVAHVDESSTRGMSSSKVVFNYVYVVGGPKRVHKSPRKRKRKCRERRRQQARRRRLRTKR